MNVHIKLDLIQTVAFAGAMLFLGYGLRRLVPALARVNIPAAVCGGLPVAAVVALLRAAGHQVLAFDTTLQVLLISCPPVRKLFARVSTLAAPSPRMPGS